MKKFAAFVVLLLLFTGCSRKSDEMETAMELRSKLLRSSGCSFRAEITADYGDSIQTFSLDCQADAEGDLVFSVAEPETIAGITGKLTGTGGVLTFDDVILPFDLLAQGQLSPISAPWILLKSLRSGYIVSGCQEEDGIVLSVDDSFEEDPLRLDIWLDREQLPARADILFDGRRILSVAVTSFVIL